MPRLLFLIPMGFFLLLSTLGCSHASVECNATVNNTAVPTGYLTFNPSNDIEAASVTAQVNDGVVTLVDNEAVTPGPMTIYLTTSEEWLDPEKKTSADDTDPANQAVVTLSLDFDVPDGPFELNFEYPQPASDEKK